MKVTLGKKINREYAFFFLRSEAAIQRIRMASSSGVPHVNSQCFESFRRSYLRLILQQKFGKFALNSEAAIEALTRKKMNNLHRTRNLLLPRLPSNNT